ncbi:hypothetical protein HDU81_009730 [Chytriomyces hyalinus]|nr:hypothetical protein HDU81_009730 [Chytriomyces hyalinus]
MNADEADAEEFDDSAETNGMKMDVDDMDNDSDADPVVQEIPVYLALGLDGLVLMQHPSSRKNHPLSTAVAMRCKPVAHRFEVEVPLSVHSDNYNIDMGERLGLGLDNEDILTAYDKRNPFGEEKRKLLEKQTLQSSLLPVSSGGQYLIGALRDDEFHLTPISATIQLRPALRYLDKILEKERVANAKIQQHELNLEQGVNADKKSAADLVEKGVNVSVRNVEDNPEALRRAKDLDEEKRFALEEWVDLKLYDEDAPESQETYERLFSLGDELTYSFSKEDYLESVGPKLSTSSKAAIESGKSNIKPNWSFDDIMNLPLPSLLTSLLVHVQVIAFSQIMELTDNQFDESDILDELERIAVLVRGVWVIRSELMYSGRVADARRYLLYILARTGSKPVSRYEINKIAKLPHSVITNLFIDICARNPLVTEAHTGHVSSGPAADRVSWVVGKGIATAPAMWGLKSEPDVEFCANYPAVVKRQTDIVVSEGERAKQALETKSGSKIQHASIKNESSNAPASSSRAMPATAAASFSRPSGASNGAAATSGAGASSSGAPAAAPGKQSARATSNNNSNASIAKFPLSGATMEEQAENLLFFIFQKFGVCSEEFVVSTTMMHKDGHEGTAENLLDADEVNESFVKELLNTFCVKVQDRYVLKSLNGPIDEFRTPVVNLFMTKNTVRKVDITAACQTATGKNVPQSMYIKIMKELAVSSGPTWTPKNSVLTFVSVAFPDALLRPAPAAENNLTRSRVMSDNRRTDRQQATHSSNVNISPQITISTSQQQQQQHPVYAPIVSPNGEVLGNRHATDSTPPTPPVRVRHKGSRGSQVSARNVRHVDGNFEAGAATSASTLAYVPQPPPGPPPAFVSPNKPLRQADISILANQQRMPLASLTHTTNTNLAHPRISTVPSNGSITYSNRSVSNASSNEQLGTYTNGPPSPDLQLEIDRGLLENKFWRQNNLALLHLPMSGFTERPSELTENLSIAAPMPPSPMSINWIADSHYGDVGDQLSTTPIVPPQSVPPPAENSVTRDDAVSFSISRDSATSPTGGEGRKKMNALEFLTSKLKRSSLFSKSTVFEEKNQRRAQNDNETSTFGFRSRSPENQTRSQSPRNPPFSFQRSASPGPESEMRNRRPMSSLDGRKPALWQQMTRSFSANANATNHSTEDIPVRSKSPLGRARKTVTSLQPPPRQVRNCFFCLSAQLFIFKQSDIQTDLTPNPPALDPRSKTVPGPFRKTTFFMGSSKETKEGDGPASSIGHISRPQTMSLHQQQQPHQQMYQQQSQPLLLPSKQPIASSPLVSRRTSSPVAQSSTVRLPTDTVPAKIVPPTASKALGASPRYTSPPSPEPNYPDDEAEIEYVAPAKSTLEKPRRSSLTQRIQAMLGASKVKTPSPSPLISKSNKRATHSGGTTAQKQTSEPVAFTQERGRRAAAVTQQEKPVENADLILDYLHVAEVLEASASQSENATLAKGIVSVDRQDSGVKSAGSSVKGTDEMEPTLSSVASPLESNSTRAIKSPVEMSEMASIPSPATLPEKAAISLPSSTPVSNAAINATVSGEAEIRNNVPAVYPAMNVVPDAVPSVRLVKTAPPLKEVAISAKETPASVLQQTELPLPARATPLENSLNQKTEHILEESEGAKKELCLTDVLNKDSQVPASVVSGHVSKVLVQSTVSVVPAEIISVGSIGQAKEATSSAILTASQTPSVLPSQVTPHTERVSPGKDVPVPSSVRLAAAPAQPDIAVVQQPQPPIFASAHALETVSEKTGASEVAKPIFEAVVSAIHKSVPVETSKMLPPVVGERSHVLEAAVPNHVVVKPLPVEETPVIASSDSVDGLGHDSLNKALPPPKVNSTSPRRAKALPAVAEIARNVPVKMEKALGLGEIEKELPTPIQPTVLEVQSSPVAPLPKELPLLHHGTVPTVITTDVQTYAVAAESELPVVQEAIAAAISIADAKEHTLATLPEKVAPQHDSPHETVVIQSRADLVAVVSNKDLPPAVNKDLPPAAEVSHSLSAISPNAELVTAKNVPEPIVETIGSIPQIHEKEVAAMTAKDLPQIISIAKPASIESLPPVPDKSTAEAESSRSDVDIIHTKPVQISNPALALAKEVENNSSEYSFSESEEFEVNFTGQRNSQLSRPQSGLSTSQLHSSGDLAPELASSGMIVLESDGSRGSEDMLVTVIEETAEGEKSNGTFSDKEMGLIQSTVLVSVPGVRITEMVPIEGSHDSIPSVTEVVTAVAADLGVKTPKAKTEEMLPAAPVELDEFVDANSAFTSPVVEQVAVHETSLPVPQQNVQPAEGCVIIQPDVAPAETGSAMESGAASALAAPGLNQEIVDTELPSSNTPASLTREIIPSTISSAVFTSEQQQEAAVAVSVVPERPNSISKPIVTSAFVSSDSVAAASNEASAHAPATQTTSIKEIPLAPAVREEASTSAETLEVEKPKADAIAPLADTRPEAGLDNQFQVHAAADPVTAIEPEQAVHAVGLQQRKSVRFAHQVATFVIEGDSEADVIVPTAQINVGEGTLPAVKAEPESKASATTVSVAAKVEPEVNAIVAIESVPVKTEVDPKTSRTIDNVVAKSESDLKASTTVDSMLVKAEPDSIALATSDGVAIKAETRAAIDPAEEIVHTDAIPVDVVNVIHIAPSAEKVLNTVPVETKTAQETVPSRAIDVSSLVVEKPLEIERKSEAAAIPPVNDAVDASAITSQPKPNTVTAPVLETKKADDKAVPATMEIPPVPKNAQQESEEGTAVEEIANDVSSDHSDSKSKAESLDAVTMAVQPPEGLVSGDPRVNQASATPAEVAVIAGFMPSGPPPPPGMPPAFDPNNATGFYGTPEQIYHQQVAYYQQMQYFAQQWQQQQLQQQQQQFSMHSFKQQNRASSEFSSSASDIASMTGIMPSDSASNYSSRKKKSKPASIYSVSPSVYQQVSPSVDAWSHYFSVRPSFKKQKSNSWTPKRRGEVLQHLNALRGNVQRASQGQERSSTRALLDFSRFCIQDSMSLEPPEREELLNEAFDILKRLCFQGNSEAQFLVGCGYNEDSNYETAYLLLYNAAIQKHGGACGKLGALIVSGKCAETDVNTAVKFFKKGLKYGDSESAYKLGQGYAHGTMGLALNFAEGLRLLNECAKDSASDCRPKALFEISRIYELGSDEIPVNKGIALSALNDAAKGGYVPAITKIADCYRSGKFGLRVDEKKAMSLYKTAADLGDMQARDALSSMRSQ